MDYKELKKDMKDTLDWMNGTAGMLEFDTEAEAEEKLSAGYELVYPRIVCLKGFGPEVRKKVTECASKLTLFLHGDREGRHEELVDMFLTEYADLPDKGNDDAWLYSCSLSYKDLYLHKHLSDAWQEAHRRITHGTGKA